MSIASISPGTSTTASSGLSPASAGSASTGKAGASTAASSSGSSVQITNTTQTVNADGTITVVTTYADGTTSQTTEPNPNPVTNQGTLSSSNSGQLSTLLAAQEQSQSGTTGKAA
jgi:hypothetical protein